MIDKQEILQNVDRVLRSTDLKNLGEDHHEVAAGRSNLATVMYALGDLPRAETLLEQALASELESLGESDISSETIGASNLSRTTPSNCFRTTVTRDYSRISTS